MKRWMHCRDCGNDLPDPIDTLNGFCADCRELNAVEARRHWTVVPMHKSNYFLCTNRDDLKGINNKGGLVR